MKAPFPYFGGKSRAASIVWQRFGDCDNYVDPFCGSLAVLLLRPTPAKLETVNDKDGFVCNFWRALQADPQGVACFADWPVNEIDLFSRHKWLMQHGRRRVELLQSDPTYYDVQTAGWWVWGLSCWIGDGWCRDTDSRRESLKRPILSTGGAGIHRETLISETVQKMPKLSHIGGIHSKRVSLGNAGKGVNSASKGDLYQYFDALSARLRRVRVCCGDWMRVTSPSVTTGNGLTAMFLDPPYALSTGRDSNIYSQDDHVISGAVRDWAIANGDNPKLRIALCGYEGEHEMPASWACQAWTGPPGYTNIRAEVPSVNRHRERIWFSPHCLTQHSLFSEEAE